MKTPLSLILTLGLLLSLRAQQGPQDLKAFFSPNGGCTQAVVDALNAAKKTILVQAYSFTSVPIAKALVEAKHRGVDVRVILDKSQRTERYSGATFLANEGIPTFIDAAHRIAHNKVMVIDGQEVITGSFNFTKAAESGNAENVLLDPPRSGTGRPLHGQLERTPRPRRGASLRWRTGSMGKIPLLYSIGSPASG